MSTSFVQLKRRLFLVLCAVVLAGPLVAQHSPPATATHAPVTVACDPTTCGGGDGG